MQNFVVGQRWMSETEPELGLGLLVEIQSKSLSFSFPQAQEIRTYGKTHPPVKRVRFVIDDEISLQDGRKLKVVSVEETEGILYYHTVDEVIPETALSAHLQFSKPEERFLNGFIDSHSLFTLRKETLQRKREILSHPLRGLLGGKISLIPHQLYIAYRSTQHRIPRVLLADEVGLGKTIEASLMIMRLILSGKAQRVIILLPDSLVHQWFFELYRKFSLSFTLINQETELEKGRNPFLDSEHMVVSLGLLKGSELAQNLLKEASFDLLVVDEVHALKVKGEKESFEFSLVKEMAAKTPGLIMLSATPEQFGEEAHFERLKMIDPYKFSDFATYKKEKEEFRPLADLLKKLQDQKGLVKDWDKSIVDELCLKLSFDEIKDLEYDDLIELIVDRFGTGRMYFRNLRKTMDKEFLFFPKRVLKPFEIELEKKKAPDFLKDDSIDALFEAKALWLMEKIQDELKNKKILLICKTKKKILELEEFLKRHLSHIKIASFHSDLGLMARDRQAAYFADPEGAQILLCTEVGSEGRNFEFCQDLVLFDIPLHPHPLEQRIGRLDRIGQKKDITLHLPYMKNSWEEVLYGWYHIGLEVFDRSTEASAEVFEFFKNELLEQLQKPDIEKLPAFLEKVKNHRLLVEDKLNEGRDVLVEKNSFHPVKARQLHRELSKRDADDSLSEYMGRIFEAFGVDVEDVQASTWYIRPSDNMFVPAFPHLDQDGKTITFSRTKALEREDYDFMTWDHPMVLGAMDLILSQNFGSSSLAIRQKRGAQGNFYLEGHYTLDCAAPSLLNLERFGIGEIVRLLVDDKGTDLSEKFSYELIESKITEPDQEILKAIKNFPKDKLLAVKRKADAYAQEVMEKKIQECEARVVKFYQDEISRLKSLSKDNTKNFDKEIQEFEFLKNESLAYLKKSSWKLDSMRMIL